MGNQLNLDSILRINNIVNGLKSHPFYTKYTIKSYLYDEQGGIYAIEVRKDGLPINLFLFYPDESSNSGKIGSIAIYGDNLNGHYDAMKNSMTAFGMRISRITKEFGVENYLDVYLSY